MGTPGGVVTHRVRVEPAPVEQGPRRAPRLRGGAPPFHLAMTLPLFLDSVYAEATAQSDADATAP